MLRPEIPNYGQHLKKVIYKCWVFSSYRKLKNKSDSERLQTGFTLRLKSTPLKCLQWTIAVAMVHCLHLDVHNNVIMFIWENSHLNILLIL